MKLFLLFSDFLIISAYGGVCYYAHPQAAQSILIVLLFFAAARVLALAVHDAFSVINLLLLVALAPYDVALLAVLYLLYAGMYFYLLQREQKQRALEEENTKLQIEAAQVRRYRLLQDNFEMQLSLNMRLEERRRIAQQIHDLLGHSMSAAILQLEAANTLMEKDRLKAGQMVGQATASMREGISRIREAVHQMRAEVPALYAAQLETIVEQFRRGSGLQVNYRLEGSIEDASREAAAAIAGNLREALTNIARHAQATQVDITLSALPGVLRLEVADNGIGCAGAPEGMGIAGMRERAQEAGGKLIIRHEKGTHIITLAPRKEKTL